MSSVTQPATDAASRGPFQFSLQAVFAHITLAGISYGLWTMGGLGPILIMFAVVYVFAAFEHSMVRPHRYLFATLLLQATLVLMFTGYAAAYFRCHGPDKRAVIRTRVTHMHYLLEHYELQHGRRPAMRIGSPDGKGTHSWRAALLEGIDPVGTASLYDWTQNWNSKRNLRIGSEVDFAYNASTFGERSGEASFVALDVPGGYPDGRFLLMFVTHSGIKTLEPRDVTVADLTSGKVHGAYGLGSPVVLLWPDGNIETVSIGELQEKVDAYLTWKRKVSTQPNGRRASGN